METPEGASAERTTADGTIDASVSGDGDRSGDDAPVLSIRNLSKTYGSGEAAVRAVEDVSFAVESGTVVGLLGPNGAGKTTTIKSILGLVVPSTGSVAVGGIDVHENARSAYRRMGAMLEGARNVYWKLTVRENLSFFAAVGGESPSALTDRHEELLEQLDLAEKADAPVNDLSRGQKQKVALACALARDVDVAFLDEPTLGLDVESSRRLRGEISRLAEQESMTIVLSSHDMQVVEDVCDRVVIMNGGRIVADDSVDSLVDVFGSHAYRVVVDGQLEDGVRREVRERFDVQAFDEVTGTSPRYRFEVLFADETGLSALIDVLREANLGIVEATPIDPDLETVFLELTGEDPVAHPNGGVRSDGDLP